MKVWIQRLAILVVLVGVAVAVGLAMAPQPVAVDLVEITRGPLVVTITDDGQTRIRERYVVSAPLSGRLLRIRLKPGDDVEANLTQLTLIEATDPALLDPRAIAQAEARVAAAEARLQYAEPRVASAKVSLEHARREVQRLQELTDNQAGTRKELDAQIVTAQLAANEYQAAQFERDIAKYELDVAEAALSRGTDESQSVHWSFPVTSPISGKVLRVFQESSTIVNAGDRILEVGDPTDLEVEVDVLSTDAVRIQPGARVMLEQWGGDQPLPARVRLIEPSAFTKVSALGIEEQRVNVIIDFATPFEETPLLQDGYRVEAAIVEWESEDVLTVPVGALFRDDGEWSVFVVREDTADLRHLKLGHRNENFAEVLEGLQESERVILYPGDRVEEGITIVAREQ